jgi:hypothetical protein
VGGSPASDTLNIAVSGGTPPGAPTGVSAVRGNAQASINWVAPLSSGSSAITGYLARATQDTTKTCTTTGALTCVVSGLTNGTSYTFVVRATNAGGAGPFSSPSTAVTPATVPSAPTNVTAMQTSGGPIVITVSWTLPASTGGTPILEYYALGTPSGSCYSQAPLSGTTGSCTVTTGLTAGTPYTFRVYGVSGVGNGDTSSSSAAVTPVGIAAGSFAIRLTAFSKPFVFTLTPEGMRETEALTMTITDVYGRNVWSRTVNPRLDGTRELVWNGKTSTGRAVSSGVYLVRIATASGGTTSEFVNRAIVK